MNVRNYFSLLVIGENPDEQIKAFGPESLPTQTFNKKDIKNIKLHVLAQYEWTLDQLRNSNVEENLKNTAIASAQSRYNFLKDKDDDEFWDAITEGFEIDEETGDAIYRGNMMYEVITHAKYFAMPLINREGSQVYSARLSDVNWRATDGADADAYRVAWETVVEERKPKDKDETRIYNNMRGHKQYMLGFGSKENYIESSTKFWTYAVLKDGEWRHVDDRNDEKQFDWVHKYYERFISGLDGDTLLTLYEYKKTPF